MILSAQKLMAILLVILYSTYDANAQAISSFKELQKVTGSTNIELRTIDGQTWKTRITIPKNLDQESDKKYPLIIGLHWLSEKSELQERNYKYFSQCLLEPVFQKLPAFIISPQADEILWHTENNRVRVLTMIQEAKKHFPIDPKKIVVVGYSQGGVGSWFFAERYPDIFSAAIPIASTYPKVDSSYITIPMLVIHSERDETFPFRRIKRRIREYRGKGTDITFIRDSRLSHYTPCKYARHLEKANSWLQDNVWKEPESE